MRVMQPYEFERIRKILYKLKQYRVRHQQPVTPLFLKRETWVPYEQGTYFGEKIPITNCKVAFKFPLTGWKIFVSCKCTQAFQSGTIPPIPK